MKLLIKYRHKIVSFGLLPTIITLIGLHFFPATAMLGIGLAISLIGLAYDFFQLKSLNFFLLQGTAGIGTCFLLRLFTGYEYIPPRSMTPTLEFMLLIFAFIYLTAPETYHSLLKKFRLDSSISYRLEARVIVILSGLHLLSLFLLQNVISIHTNYVHYTLVFYAPALIYIICLIINMTGIRMAASTYENPCCVIRIAPICNGKIYLIPYAKADSGKRVWDVPLIFPFEKCPYKSERFAAEKVKAFLQKQPGKCSFISPRLILKYRIDRLTPYPIQLFILPIDKEEKSIAPEGRYFTFAELIESPENFSEILLAEKEHLQISANLWKEFNFR